MKPLIGGALLIGVGGVIGVGLLVALRPQAWNPEPLDPIYAEQRHRECMTVESIGDEFNGLTKRMDGTSKHPNLHLYSRNGIALGTLGGLIDRGRLVGAVKNESGDYASTIEGRWKRMPPGTTCIFMGGDKKRFMAEVVWKNADGTYAGQRRPIVARFNGDPHGAGDDAKWDEPIEGAAASAHGSGGTPDSLAAPAPSAYRETLPPSTEAETGPLVEATFFPIDPEPSLFQRLLGVQADGEAPWFTCSQHTCCKAL